MKPVNILLIALALAAAGFGLHAVFGDDRPATNGQTSAVAATTMATITKATTTPVAKATAASATQAAMSATVATSKSAPKIIAAVTASPASTISSTQSSAPRAAGPVCNESLIGPDGLDSHRIISLEACKKLNVLYDQGRAAGNSGDLYDNRDNLHVNLCEGWTPNPECPPEHRLFPQHAWKFSGGAGAATSPQPQTTLGQASFSGSVAGDVKHSIPYVMYGSQSGADTLYNLYVHGNLYVYPSLYEDSFAGSAYGAGALAGMAPLDKASLNKANTPYVINSKQLCACGADSLRVHDASGSDLPFIELGFAGLAAFQLELKKSLESSGLIIPTLQALIRYSHRSVASDADYFSSVAQRSSYVAHYQSGGQVLPAFDAARLVDLANGLTRADVPPLVRMKIESETFASGEKLFDTSGAVARSVAYGTESKTITVSAASSVDIDGGTSGHSYHWQVIGGDPSRAQVAVDPQDPSHATIEFTPGSSTDRIDVGVFVKRSGGRYYSVPGIVSMYVHP